MLTRTIPTSLAFALLAFQCVIPWTARYFISQDGPSHLYTAMVAHDLVVDPDSDYSASYDLNRPLTTNWTMSVLFDTLVGIAGPRHAEQALSTLCVLAGFFGFAYLLSALNPQASRWSPVLNFLVNTWFLWIGFYNFYLGMVLCAVITAFYIRSAPGLSWKATATIAVLLLILFFTHIHPFALTILAIMAVALWAQVTTPSWQRLLRTSVALLPGLIILGLYLSAAQAGPHGPSDAFTSLRGFPMHAFASGRDWITREIWLLRGIALATFVIIVTMRKQEWASPKGALVLMATASFAFYLWMPDQGLGGTLIKIRFAWAVFVFGAIAALSASRMRYLALPLALYTTGLLTPSLVRTMRKNVQAVSRAAEEASTVFDHIPQGAKAVRLRYWTLGTRNRFGFDSIALDPLFHLDSWFAAQRGWVNLSDYQALSLLFPVVPKPDLLPLRSALWGLEGGTETGGGALRALLAYPGFSPEYVVVLGDTNDSDRAQILAELNRSMTLVVTDPGKSYLWLFRGKASGRQSSHSGQAR